MPTKAFDSFTGPADQDITGRKTDGVVPGGSACPELQAGYWERVINSPSTGGMDIQENHAMRGRGIQVAGNNAASVGAKMPPCEAGDSLVLLAYSSNGSVRSPQAPAGFTEKKRVSNGANGEIVVFWKEADGSESMTTVNVSFTGLGAANVVEMTLAMAFYGGVGAVSIGAISVGDFWLTSQSLGPITGLTPGAAPSVVLLCAGKNTDFTAGGFDDGNVTQVPSTSGWIPAFAREATFGNKASWCCFYQYQSDGTPIADTTITDPGSPAHSAPGVGFMIELIVPTPPVTGELRHRCSSGAEGDWNHYILRTDPTSPLDISENYMVEAEFVIYDQNALWAALLARHDKKYEIGWEYNMQVFDDGSWFAQIYRVDENAVPGGVGVYVTLDSDFGPVGDLPYGVPFRLKMCVSGGHGEENVRCYTNDVLLFDITDPNTAHYDTWPGDALPLWPGLCLADTSAGGTGSAIVVNWWRVADLCDDAMPTPCGGCEGGPENPYPWDPPPDEPVPAYLYVQKNMLWRASPIPTPEAPGGISPIKNRNYRTATGIIVRKNLAFRVPGAGQLEPTGNPNTPEPPFYDPCNLVPEVVPSDVEPLPLTDRFVGIAETPNNVIGQVLNSTKRSIGGWTPDDLTAMTSKGCVLIGSQGGYKQYLLGGVFNKENFVSVTVSRVSPYLTLLQDKTETGEFFGYSMIDDLKVPGLWPPSGVSDADAAWILGQLRTYLPGIRIGVRAHPDIFGSNLGFDFYHCQYTSRRGDLDPSAGGAKAFNWGRVCYQKCAAWSSFCLLDLNYLAGGDGRSGILFSFNAKPFYECSAGEVIEYYSDMLDGAKSVDPDVPLLAGACGWQWRDYLPTRSGMVDAWATVRNMFAGLPALP